MDFTIFSKEYLGCDFGSPSVGTEKQIADVFASFLELKVFKRTKVSVDDKKALKGMATGIPPNLGDQYLQYPNKPTILHKR